MAIQQAARGVGGTSVPPIALRPIGTPPVGPSRPDIAHRRFSQTVAVERGQIEEKTDYTTQDYNEQGITFDRKKLVYTRTVHVEMPGEFSAVMEMKGNVLLPPSAKDATVDDLLGGAGRGYVDVYVDVIDKRGPMSEWYGFEFSYRSPGGDPPANNLVSLRTMAATGPDYVHFGLAPEVQIDTLVAEVRRRLPPRVRKPTDVTEDEFQRMTPDERSELAREAFGEEFQLSNVAKSVLVALAIAAVIFGAIALASVGGPALVIGLLMAAILAAGFALAYSLGDAFHDVISRWAESDIGGAILSFLKGLATLGAIVIGGLAVVAAILGAPLEIGLALVAIAAAVGFGLLLAHHDYARAKQAPDLEHFWKDIRRSARGVEGAISDAVTTFLMAIIGGAAKRLRPPQPSTVPPDEPTIIEPPRVAPAAPAVPEIPQVAPAAPPVSETPQVAGPTVMVPSAEPPKVPAEPPNVQQQQPGQRQYGPRQQQQQQQQTRKSKSNKTEPTPAAPFGPLEGERNYDVFDSRGNLITDIDHIEGDTLWEEKSAVNATDPDKWVKENVTEKFDAYMKARDRLPVEYKNAKIGFRFTEVPKSEFFNVVLNEIERLQAAHPGIVVWEMGN